MISITLSAIAFLFGCGKSVEDSLWQQVKILQEEKTNLTLDNERLQNKNEQMTQQIETLRQLDASQRKTAIDTLYKIEIGSRSGWFDKNNDGINETLIVYVFPLDTAQDSVKAAGKMDVELWNLDTTAPQSGLLKKWQIQPDELFRLWANILTGQCYRLSFPADDIVKDNLKNLTIKVQFTDYNTGKVLAAQRAIQ